MDDHGARVLCLWYSCQAYDGSQNECDDVVMVWWCCQNSSIWITQVFCTTIHHALPSYFFALSVGALFTLATVLHVASEYLACLGSILLFPFILCHFKAGFIETGFTVNHPTCLVTVLPRIFRKAQKAAQFWFWFCCCLWYWSRFSYWRWCFGWCFCCGWCCC